MRNVRVWRGLLAVDQRTVIEEIEFEEFEEHGAGGDILVVARVRPRSGLSRRCGPDEPTPPRTQSAPTQPDPNPSPTTAQQP